MLPLNSSNLNPGDIDQIIEEFSSDELLNLSDDLLKIAIELTLQEDLDIPEVDSITRGNDLLVIIPKVIASRLNKAEIYLRKFASLNNEELIFAGYSARELRGIRKLLEDVISLIERRSQDDLHVIYREVFEELKENENFEMDVEVYRNALKNVNEAYKIQSRHLMNLAIEVYKHITSYNFEHFLHEKIEVLEGYQNAITNAIELLETSAELREKYEEQLHGLRKTLILVLEALSTHTIGIGFSKRKLSYIHEILYHIRHNPEDYIFEVLQRFATIAREKALLSYMTPEEIAVRYKTRYIKHNRVLLSFISNPVKVSKDFLLEVSNNILKNLSIALNVKLQFIRTGNLCDQILEASVSEDQSPYHLNELHLHAEQIQASLAILEKYTINSDYLEALQERCYRVSLLLLKWIAPEDLMQRINLLRQYQIYAARRLFVLRISTLCMFIANHTPQQLSVIASERVLKVCLGLIQYKYDFLKPSSIHLESRFDLEYYRQPVMSKINSAVQALLGEDLSSESSSLTLGNDQQQLKTFFSQLVIDCLALKVQELESAPGVLTGETALKREEIQAQIKTSEERIEYFLKAHEEERVEFLQLYQREKNSHPNTFKTLQLGKLKPTSKDIASEHEPL